MNDFERAVDFVSRGLPGLDREEVERLWSLIRGHELPGPVALVTLDTAARFGARRAALELQLATKVKPDGIVGPRTTRAVWYRSLAKRDLAPRRPETLAEKLVRQRARLLAARLRRDPARVDQLSGWVRHTLDLQRAALEWGDYCPVKERVRAGLVRLKAKRCQ